MKAGGTHRTVTAVGLVLAFGVGGFIIPASASNAGWSISISGDRAGTAKKIEPQCAAPSNEGGPLLARASFKLDGRRLTISAYFAAPAAPGSRAFGTTPGASTVVVNVTDVRDPSASWLSGTDGTGTIADDRRSGTIQGTLVGARGELGVDASFRCPRLDAGRRGGGGGGSPSDRAEDSDAAPSFSGTAEGTVGGNVCTGSESGPFDVFGFDDGTVLAGVIGEGSYTCSGVTIPTSGAIFFEGRFKNKTLTLRHTAGGIIGGTPMLLGCLVDQTLKIRVRDGKGSVSPEYTAPSSDVYQCTYTVEQVG
jgi:hypothetical protein